MPIYKPTELIAFLESLGISPKRTLSQNFLIDGNIVRKIVAEAAIEPNDVVIEIGPGPGCLTEELLEKGANVIAIEKDNTLAAALTRLDKENRLSVICEDVLKISLSNLIKKNFRAKILGNLPYHIATAILTKFIPASREISTITVMVQEEMARRFTAEPKTKAYGSLTIFLQFYANVKYAFKVSKNSFFPPPSVDSAIVTFELKEPEAGIDTEKFFNLTRKAFQTRRKMLKKSLKDLYSVEAIETSLKSLNISELARPEELSLDQFILLFKLLERSL